MLEDRAALLRDLDRLEKWAHTNLVVLNNKSEKLNRISYAVVQAGNLWLESEVAVNDFTSLGDTKLNVSQKCAFT